MAAHSLYPGFWKLYYTANGHQHIMTVPVYPSLVGGVWLHKDKNGDIVNNLTVAATAFVTAIKPFWVAASNFDYVELWTKADENAQAVFQSAVNLNVAGTSAGATLALGMAVFTFRTVAGGLWRLYMMEPALTVNVYAHAPFSGPYATMETALCASTSYIAARDNSFLASLASYATKYSDALRKKFVLNAA